MKLFIKLFLTTLVAGAFVAAPVNAERLDNPKSQQQTVAESLNLNFASQKELQTLPGIGKKKAQAIIEYRESHGNFKNVEELTRVKGIGKKLLEKLNSKINI